jgi:hypothetical protein
MARMFLSAHVAHFVLFSCSLCSVLCARQQSALEFISTLMMNVENTANSLIYDINNFALLAVVYDEMTDPNALDFGISSKGVGKEAQQNRNVIRRFPIPHSYNGDSCTYEPASLSASAKASAEICTLKQNEADEAKRMATQKAIADFKKNFKFDQDEVRAQEAKERVHEQNVEAYEFSQRSGADDSSPSVSDLSVGDAEQDGREEAC